MIRFVVMSAVAAAGLVGAFWVLVRTSPKLQMAQVIKALKKEAGGPNQFLHRGLPDASTREIVKLSPDLTYSYLAYDLRKCSLLIDLPAWNDYWVLQMVDSGTNSFAYAGSRTYQDKAARVLLTHRAHAPATAPPGCEVFVSPTPTGMVLLRYLVRDPEHLARIDEARRSIEVAARSHGGTS